MNKSDVARREVAVRELEAAAERNACARGFTTPPRAAGINENARMLFVSAQLKRGDQKRIASGIAGNNIVYRESRIQDLHDELTKRQMAFDDEVDSARVLLQHAAEKRKEFERARCAGWCSEG